LFLLNFRHLRSQQSKHLSMEDRHPDLVCAICQELFTDCVQTPCCGNGFCSECLDSSLKATHGTCPSCRKAITIFQCTSNKMIQRMVDNLPVECTWCDAKLTRSIQKEHLQKCDKRPGAPVIVNPGNKCLAHPEVDPSLVCLDDDSKVCPVCALIGKYRYRDCSPLGMYEAVKNVAGLSASLKSELAINKSTLLFWLNTALCEVASLHAFSTSNSQPVIEDNPDSAKPEEDPEFVKIVKLVSLATWFCFQGKKELTKENIFEVLKVVLLPSPNGPSISISHPMLTCIDDNRLAVTEFLSGRKPTSKPELDLTGVSANNNNNGVSGLTDEEEYKLLKEKYDNEHFNFSGLQVRTLPLCQHVVRGYTNNIPVLIELRSGKMKEEDKEKRPPFSLALVLDRSGSMGGTKLVCAIEAVINCIKSLLPGDLLHLVTFDSVAEVVFENGTLEQAPQLIGKVAGMQARGSTGMTRGLNAAIEILRRETGGRTRKIFVFSDGCTDEGNGPNLALAEQYAKEGVGLSSFGIGTDFDEKFMKAMSDKAHGNGNYFFIDSPQSAPKFVEKAFRGLSRTVATDVVLKIRGNNGCKVNKLNSPEDLFKGLPLNDLREKDLKQVVVEVEVPAEACGNLNTVDLFSLEISYSRIGDHIPEGPYTADLKLNTTDDWSLCSQYNDDVLVFLKIGECAQLDKAVANFVASSRVEDAIKKKERVMEILKDIADKDSIGFAKVMLLRAKERVKDLRELRVNRSKMEYVKKHTFKEAEEEEDDDMGYGLFD